MYMLPFLTVITVSPINSNFCGTCNRLRVTADGQLKVCLFGMDGLDLLQSMRGEHFGIGYCATYVIHHLPHTMYYLILFTVWEMSSRLVRVEALSQCNTIIH